MRVERLIKELKNETGIDFFKNTNKRQYVEVRALFSYFLRNYFGYTLREIVEVYRRNGFSTHHATIIYACKSYKDSYVRFSPTLKQLDSEDDYQVRQSPRCEATNH
jgi:chromosomal replication initiation ATPase DnaA